MNKPSLEERIDQLIDEIAEYYPVDEDGDNGWLLSDNSRSQLVAAILEAVNSCVPKKFEVKQIGGVILIPDKQQGYNNAIEDFNIKKGK